MEGIYFGHKHDPSGVIYGTQIVEHSIDFPVDRYLPDDKMRNLLINGVYHDETFTGSGHSLANIIDECILYNVIPIININAVWWYGKEILNQLGYLEYAKMASMVRDYLKSRGFKKGQAFISCFNEPKKWIDEKQICSYTNEVHKAVGADFDVIYGNDEFNAADWNYLGKNCKAKVMGIHHLSSLGSWEEPKKYWSNIRDGKTIANTYGKKIICSEGGSWFKKYIGEGHELVNKALMADCKKYEYLACLIVMVDINEKEYNVDKRLGYRIWDINFLNIVNQNEIYYFNDFINFIAKEGYVVKYNPPMKLQSIANFLNNKVGNYDPDNIPLLSGIGFWQNDNYAHKKSQFMTKADFEASAEKIIKMILKLTGQASLAEFELYYKTDGSWNPVTKREQFAKSNPA